MNRLLPSIVAVVALGSACGQESSLVVTVDSELGVPCAINNITVEITTSSGETVSERVDVTDADLPGSITFAGGSSSGQLTVTVTGRLDDLVVAVGEESGVTLEDGKNLELGFVLGHDCTDGSCAAVRRGEFSDLPAKASRIACGQERYSMPITNASPRSACDETGAAVVLTDTDEQEVDISAELPLPFAFFFYGRPVTELWVGDNGYLSFGGEPSATTSDVGDPRSLESTGGFPAGGVLPFWDKTRTSTAGICAAVLGSAPNRRYLVSWDSSCFEGPSCGAAEQGNLTYTVTLNEADDSIVVGFVNMQAAAPNADRANGLSAVIGVRNDSAPACTAAMCMDGTCMDSGDPCNYTQRSATTVVEGGLSGVSFEFAPE